MKTETTFEPILKDASKGLGKSGPKTYDCHLGYLSLENLFSHGQ